MSKTFEVVPFHGHEILTVSIGEEIIVPLKPIVDAIGLAWNAQFERVKRHPVLSKGIRVTRIPSAGGMQEMVGLALNMLPGFLATIQSERIKEPVVRERVILFQAEAFEVLFAHFFGNKRPGSIGPGASTGDLLKLVDRLKTEWQPEIKAMLHAVLAQTCERLNVPLPSIEAFGQPSLPDLEIGGVFFGGLMSLREAGVMFDHHRQDDVLAVSLPEIGKLFEKQGIECPRNHKLWRALRAHPAFVDVGVVNSRDGRSRHCWMFKRAKLPGLA